MRIIAADDDDMNRKLLDRMFQHLGHEIKVVSSGKELIEAVLNEEFDIALVDMQMPEIDGYSAVKILKERAGTKHLPLFIAITGYQKTSDYYTAGFDGYLGKPFTLEDLSNLVNTHKGKF